jgi:hypothetical protein
MGRFAIVHIQRPTAKLTALSQNDASIATFELNICSNKFGTVLLVDKRVFQEADHSGAIYLFRHDGTAWFQQAYIKASNSQADDEFGRGLALSADGNTLVAGATKEASNATGINGDQSDNSTDRAGAVYVFRYDGTDWFQQAYIKASNTRDGMRFGTRVALSTDGITLAVGVLVENGCDAGVGGDPNNDTCGNSGAVYVLRFDGVDWAHTAYVKSSNPEGSDVLGDAFGGWGGIALSADGTTLAVAADEEDSNATGIGGEQNDNSIEHAGAVYIY